MRKVILASQSQHRKLILSYLNVPFEVLPADIDEKAIRDDDPSKRAEKIARAKAEKIASNNDGVIVAADTFTVLDGKVLEKPKDKEEAKVFLKMLSGKSGYDLTGFCYLDREKNIDYSKTFRTDFTFRELYKDEIEGYVKNNPVTEWAAGFGFMAPYTTTMISEIHGSFAGLAYGFPIEIVVPLLRKSGFEPIPTKV